MRPSSKIGFVALALLWGSEWLLGALLPAPPPLAGLALRYGIASLLLFPFLLHRARRLTFGRALLWPMAIGIGLLCLPQWLIVLSAQHLPGAFPIAALAAVPVLLGAAGRLQLGTALCGFAGVLFLTGAALELSWREVPWLLCALAAAAVLAVSLVLAESKAAGSSVLLLLWSGTTASAMVLVLAAHLVGEPIIWCTTLVGASVIGAVLMTLGGYGLFFALLPQLGAARLSTLTWAQLLVATVESALIEHIRPTWEAGLGAVLIGAALVLALRSGPPGDDLPGAGLILQMTQR